MAKPKLSEAQRKVMKWLGYGWNANPGAGTTLVANGQTIGNTSTLKALERMGYVESYEGSSWRATQSGRSVTGLLCL